MRRFGAVLLLSLTACASSQVEIIPRDELPANVYGAVGPPRQTSVKFYLVEGNRLVAVAREGKASRPPEEVALLVLLQGPNAEEAQDGLKTEIPTATELLGVEVEDGVAEVNFSRGFLNYRTGIPSSIQSVVLRAAQVVWTLDELPDINSVRFLMDGQPQTIFDQFRNPIDGPVARGRFSNLAPRSDTRRPANEAPLRIDV